LILDNNKELTQKEWNALCIIHKLTLRLDIGIRFDWSKSIDVKHKSISQIIDESVFLNKETKKIIISKSKSFYGNHGRISCNWYRCTKCNSTTILELDKYCSKCGTELIWEE